MKTSTFEKKLSALEKKSNQLPSDANERVVEAARAVLKERRKPGDTRRGIPANYAGGDPSLCNARTKSGRPCRALGLPTNGRCKWHGGLSTGPRTVEGLAITMHNLKKHRKLLDRTIRDLEHACRPFTSLKKDGR